MLHFVAACCSVLHFSEAENFYLLDFGFLSCNFHAIFMLASGTLSAWAAVCVAVCVAACVAGCVAVRCSV